jgi:hypothetical protein
MFASPDLHVDYPKPYQLKCTKLQFCLLFCMVLKLGYRKSMGFVLKNKKRKIHRNRREELYFQIIRHFLFMDNRTVKETKIPKFTAGTMVFIKCLLLGGRETASLFVALVVQWHAVTVSFLKIDLFSKCL